MILPTKGILPRQALLSVGADILRLLTDSKTVSRLWSEYRKQSEQSVTFDWFVLGLDLLFLFGAIEFERGRIRRTAVRSQPGISP